MVHLVHYDGEHPLEDIVDIHNQGDRIPDLDLDPGLMVGPMVDLGVAHSQGP